MNAPEANRPLQLLAFGALAAFVAAQWVTLVSEPPLVGALFVALAACATALALASLGGGMPRIGAWAVAALVAAAALAAGVLALGLGPGLLVPGGWSELSDGIGQGLDGLADANYPYEGQNPWVRRAILLELPLALALAALLAFWPGRRRHPVAALVVLLSVFGVAATVNPPATPVLWGLALLVLIVAWFWLPALDGRSVPASAAAVAAAGAIGLGAGFALDGDEPWIDWTSWSWPGDEPSVDYRWNHTYGPIDWPREGTGLLRVESEEPHYWRAIALEHFDGFRWEVETERSNIYRPLEQPMDVEGRPAGSLNPNWIERVTFTIGALDSGLLVAPGHVLGVDGLDGVVPGSGATSLTSEPLNEGDEYTTTSYVPEPSASRLRSAPDGYAPSLRNYTRLELPRPLPGDSSVFATRNLTVPLRGEPAPPAPLRRLEQSIYGDVQALARRLTAGAPTTYDAVTAIEQHLRRNYDYSESPPEREVPLRAFLFKDRIGYCQQFSGSMALMLRTLGIPSRVASGFSSGEREEGGGAFQVTDRDAHSWVEVYFNGIGWVAFEPTPAAAPAGAQLTELAGTRLTAPVGPNAVPRRGLVIPTVAGLVGRESADEGGGRWPAVLRATLVAAGLALLVALALAAAFVLRTMRTRRLGPDQLAAAQARELERALPRLGFPIPEGSTLLELERRHAGRRGVARYIAALRSCRYMPGRPVPGRRDRAALRRELSADRGLGGRLRALLAIPPGAPRG